jgi:hypothetical protein
MIGQLVGSLFVKKKDHPSELISFSDELLLYDSTICCGEVEDFLLNIFIHPAVWLIDTIFDVI